MHLVYITYGPNEKNHVQAYFSIYSFLARNAPIKSINVITDQPLFYKNIEKHINIIPVTSQILSEWQGKYSFSWRIKLKSIELMCRKHPGEAVLYLDTDTILYNNFSRAADIIANGHAGMHESEGTLAQVGTKTAGRFEDGIKHITFDGIKPFSTYEMWNAGAVLIPNTHQCADIELILKMCDKMLEEKAHTVLIEQFSLSVGLKKFYGLEPLSPFIAHYWSNKDEWNEMIFNFFLSNNLQCLTEKEIIEKFKSIDFSTIPEKRIKKNSNRRLKKLVDKYFVDKKVRYLRTGN
ncbi:MAG: hypothetical protein ABIS36_09820 [Chryseolinea sp.]